jgi:hypothetical protein
MFGTGTNSIISQLLFTLSHCNPIPPNIAFQLDNCASNKCYTLLGTLGLLLLWIPELTNVTFLFFHNIFLKHCYK